MREILFRGKRKDNGEWVEGFLCKKYFAELPHDRYAIMFKTEYDPKRWNPDYMTAEIIPETVGQFTGMTDKNGEKMFEGDIVKGLFLHGSSILSVVTFKDGAFGLEWNRGTVKTFSAFTSICNVTYEKIGSIHDNPDLLKEGVDNG